jgi:hypothetical protein
MGGRACSICSNPETAAITKQIADGIPFSAVASRFSVKASSVHRHATNCLRIRRNEQKSATVPAQSDASVSSRFAPDDTDALAPSSLLRRASGLMDDVQGIIDRARSSGDDRLALQAQRELRESLRLAMQAIGMLSDGATVVVDQRKIELRTNIGELSVEHLRALAEGRVAITGGSIDQEPSC